MAVLAFIDMLIATMQTYLVWFTVDEARSCYDEYELIYRGKKRNSVMTLDFYIRLFIFGLIPVVNAVMIYLYTAQRAERLEEWLEIIRTQFTLESR